MKMFKYLTLAIATLSAGSMAARATDLSVQFSFNDPNGFVSGDFTLAATAVPGDPGAFMATAGTLELNAPMADGIAGTYSLVTNPGGTNSQYSATGMFIYDDLVMPGSDPIVTNPGLLAFGGPGLGNVPEGKGSEINFFSNGAGSYSLYTASNGNYNYSYVFTMPQGTVTAQVLGVPGGVRSLVAAPEPATWAIMASFLLIALCKFRPIPLGREEQSLA
jgi:hypothetical protein